MTLKKLTGFILILLLLCLENTGCEPEGISGSWVVVQENMKYNTRIFVLKPDGAFATYTCAFQPVEQTGRYYVDFSKQPAWIDFETNGSINRAEGYLQMVGANKMLLYTNSQIPLEPVYLSGQTIIPKRPIALDRSVYTLTLRRLQ
ncbi:MAG TPA: hypothetical protein VHY08_10310 [Bacillota bacterium]|nr:hypothetical protein [Bacillota bacterium]